MPKIHIHSSLIVATGLLLSSAQSATALEMTEIGQIQIGDGEGFAEMIRYHSESESLMVTASETGTIERISMSNPAVMSMMPPLDLDGGDVTAVAVHDNLVAASIKAKAADVPGTLKLFDVAGNLLARFETGALPDNVAFSPDGRYLLTANEGEPSDDYMLDPEGSFTLIDLAGGAANAKVTQISLDGIEAPAGSRIVKPGSSFAADAEPEYVAFAPDGKTAYVTLQENNAVAVIDIDTAQVAKVVGLGVKNVSRTSHDMSNKDGGINMKRWPVLMMYQPDAVVAYNVKGATYLVTANEGDAKDYDGFSEETRVGKLKLDGTLIFDSGNAFEQVIAKRSPDAFNANGGVDEFDDRSDDKGPEPEALALGEIDGRNYAFIGMERNNAIFAYDITLPSDPHMVGYMMPASSHNSPEGLEFIAAKDSPTGKPLLAIAYEMTGTIGVYQID